MWHGIETIIDHTKTLKNSLGKKVEHIRKSNTVYNPILK